jgi:hypothetical protein
MIVVTGEVLPRLFLSRKASEKGLNELRDHSILFCYLRTAAILKKSNDRVSPTQELRRCGNDVRQRLLQESMSRWNLPIMGPRHQFLYFQ